MLIINLSKRNITACCRQRLRKAGAKIGKFIDSYTHNKNLMFIFHSLLDGDCKKLYFWAVQ